MVSDIFLFLVFVREGVVSKQKRTVRTNGKKPHAKKGGTVARRRVKKPILVESRRTERRITIHFVHKKLSRPARSKGQGGARFDSLVIQQLDRGLNLASLARLAFEGPASIPEGGVILEDVVSTVVCVETQEMGIYRRAYDNMKRSASGDDGSPGPDE